MHMDDGEPRWDRHDWRSCGASRSKAAGGSERPGRTNGSTPSRKIFYTDTSSVAEVRAAAQRLVEARYLLAGDVELCVALALERYDAVVNLDA